MKRNRPSDGWFFLARLFRVTRVDCPDTGFETFTDSATGLKLNHCDAEGAATKYADHAFDRVPTATTVIESNTPNFFRVRDALPIETNSHRFLKLRFSVP
jgi:hypothetical protein